MTQQEFIAALARLGVSKNSAARRLGISRSSVYRIANGSTEVPEVVAKLLEMYLRHGMPK